MGEFCFRNPLRSPGRFIYSGEVVQSRIVEIRRTAPMVFMTHIEVHSLTVSTVTATAELAPAKAAFIDMVSETRLSALQPRHHGQARHVHHRAG